MRPQRSIVAIDMLISPCVLRVSWSYSSLFSISASCKRHGIDPSRYLVDVLRRPPTTSTDQLTEFLPDVARHIHVRVIFVQRILNQISNSQYSLP